MSRRESRDGCVRAHFTASSGLTNLNTGVAVTAPPTAAALKSCILPWRAEGWCEHVTPPKRTPAGRALINSVLRHSVSRASSMLGIAAASASCDNPCNDSAAVTNHEEHATRRSTRACSFALHTASTASSSGASARAPPEGPALMGESRRSRSAVTSPAAAAPTRCA